MSNPAVLEAVNFLGGATQVARLRELTPWAISKWARDGLPPGQVLWLAERTGWRWTPHQLSPEIYPHPDDGLPALFRRNRRRTTAAAQ